MDFMMIPVVLAIPPHMLSLFFVIVYIFSLLFLFLCILGAGIFSGRYHYSHILLVMNPRRWGFHWR